MVAKHEIPATGSMARKIYDMIDAGNGITEKEISDNTGASARVVSLRVAELVDKGLVYQVGTKKVGDADLPAWVIVRGGGSDDVESSSAPKGRSKEKSKSDPSKYECPACGESTYLIIQDNHWVTVYSTVGDSVVERTEMRGGQIRTNCARKAVVIDPDGPFDSNGCYINPLSLICEETGRIVFGRRATRDEVEQLRKEGKISKPFCIGYENHLKTCTRLDQWINGRAEEKESKMDLVWDSAKSHYAWAKREPFRRRREEEPSSVDKSQ